MSKSALVTKNIPARTGNYTKNRAKNGGRITEITVHHTAGVTTIESLGALWQRAGRNGSSHYGIYRDKIGQYVDESDIAWTNSNWAANCRAVTIETSNSGGAPNWPIADDTMQTLIRLVADIAKRNKLGTLVVGKNLTYHSMYCATACPGPYLKSKLQYIATQANAINAVPDKPTPPTEHPDLDVDKPMRLYVTAHNCEYFSECNVDKPIGKLGNETNYRVLEYYAKEVVIGSLRGHWVRFAAADTMEYFCLVLPDRAQLENTEAAYTPTIGDTVRAVATLSVRTAPGEQRTLLSLLHDGETGLVQDIDGKSCYLKGKGWVVSDGVEFVRKAV